MGFGVEYRIYTCRSILSDENIADILTAVIAKMHIKWLVESTESGSGSFKSSEIHVSHIYGVEEIPR